MPELCMELFTISRTDYVAFGALDVASCVRKSADFDNPLKQAEALGELLFSTVFEQLSIGKIVSSFTFFFLWFHTLASGGIERFLGGGGGGGRRNFMIR